MAKTYIVAVRGHFNSKHHTLKSAEAKARLLKTQGVSAPNIKIERH